MNIYEEFETSKEKESEGVWVSVSGMEFKLKLAGGANKGFAKAFTKSTSQYKQDNSGRFRGLKDDVAEAMMYDLYARHIIVDWKGVVGRDGKPVPYSILNAIKIFTDLPLFFKLVQDAAQDIENFRVEVLEEEVGNSSPS